MALSMTQVMDEMRERALRGEPPEELLPELAEHIEDGPLGQSVKHPVYYHIMYAPEFAAICNAQFMAKQKHIRELLEEGELRSALWFWERPYRLRALLELDQTAWNPKRRIVGFGCKDYWEALADLWVDTENMYQDYALWHKALHDERPCRWAFMTKAEREELKHWRRRKAPLMIYRGYAHPSGRRGFSWTLSKARAKWFAERFAGSERHEEPTLASALVDAENVVAYLTGRDEDEIVALPEDVVIVRTERL